jgi:hypothetical protein
MSSFNHRESILCDFDEIILLKIFKNKMSPKKRKLKKIKNTKKLPHAYYYGGYLLSLSS